MLFQVLSQMLSEMLDSYVAISPKYVLLLLEFVVLVDTRRMIKIIDDLVKVTLIYLVLI